MTSREYFLKHRKAQRACLFLTLSAWSCLSNIWRYLVLLLPCLAPHPPGHPFGSWLPCALSVLALMEEFMLVWRPLCTAPGACSTQLSGGVWSECSFSFYFWFLRDSSKYKSPQVKLWLSLAPGCVRRLSCLLFIYFSRWV